MQTRDATHESVHLNLSTDEWLLNHRILPFEELVITAFTIPKPFAGHIGTIQRNSIRSWLAFVPNADILLYGNETGTADTARQFAVAHVPSVETNDFGTPLLHPVFIDAQQRATTRFMAYFNCDIMVLDDFARIVQQLGALPEDAFLVAGRRWDLHVSRELSFRDPKTGQWLRQEVAQAGRLHGYSGIDYFLFPRGMITQLPGFAVGRPGWDNWPLHHVRSRGITVFDATPACTVIHQNHPPAYTRGSEEVERNFASLRGHANLRTLHGAEWVLTPDGVRRAPLWRRMYATGADLALVRAGLGAKRRLQHLMARVLRGARR